MDVPAMIGTSAKTPILENKSKMSADIEEQTKIFLAGKDSEGFRNKIKYIKDGVSGVQWMPKYSNQVHLKKQAKAKDVKPT